MNVLYAAPRYHTNQIPVMRGWKEKGVNVMFMAQFENPNEIHDDVQYICMKPSWLTKVIFRWIEKKYEPNKVESKEQVLFMPSYGDVKKAISTFKPDIVVLRGRRIANAIIYFACKCSGIKKVILYTQNPLYSKVEKSWARRWVRKSLYPQVEFSPVLYTDTYREKQNKPKHSYFVPLITKAVEQTRELTSEPLLFLEIGKYRPYKNHFYVVDAIEKLSIEAKKVFRMTIIGQCNNSSEIELYDKLSKYIDDKGLSEQITLRSNVPFAEMDHIYEQHDVLLLASKHETAGMVILEAMGAGLCVACSIHCGLGCYLEEYDCGYTFKLDDPSYLTEIIEKMIETPALVRNLGNKSREVVDSFFSFDNYLKTLNDITIKEFDYSIVDNLE